VNVTVPDHMHFPIAYSAIEAGKHAYCQKPMCHDVAEVRALTEATRKAGVKTQLGTQAASGPGDRTFVHWVKDGVIGKIKRVVLCSNRPGAIETYRFVGPRPEKTVAPPEHLDWDLWLGTAPERPSIRGDRARRSRLLPYGPPRRGRGLRSTQVGLPPSVGVPSRSRLRRRQLASAAGVCLAWHPPRL